MCIFSRPVEKVFGTNIFARYVREEEIVDKFTRKIINHQFVAYSMNFAAAGELAMVLPIPVDSKRNNEDAVEFINLEKYSDFFKDLGKAFEPTFLSDGLVTRSATLGIPKSILTVHTVGDFDASY